MSRKTARVEFSLDRLRYQDILEDLHDGVYLVDLERRVTYWNKGAERIAGYTADDMRGTRCADNRLMHVDEHGNHLCQSGCPVQAVLEQGEVCEADIYLHHRDGHRVPVQVRIAPVRDENSAIVGAVQVFSDNSQKLVLLERIAELEQMALLDSLTGLANRRFIEDRLDVSLGELKRYGWPFGVLFVDVDHFKRVNDAYGHEIGDETLKMVARALMSNLRSFDLVGRWGGEEFVVVIQNVDRTQLRTMAERLCVLIKESSFWYESESISVTASVGATLPRPGDTVKSLVQRSDKLMYQSKRQGRDRTTFGE